MATTVEQIEQGTATTLLSTELNTLANNTAAISSVGGTSGVFTNLQATSNFNGYLRCKLELNLGAPSTTVTASTSISVWFLQTIDNGSTYEDGSASVFPARVPDCVFPLRAVNTAQRLVRRCRLPVNKWKVLLLNNGTGVSLNASGNTLKVLPETDQGV